MSSQELTMRPKTIVFEIQLGSIIDEVNLQAKCILEGAARLVVASRVHSADIALPRPVWLFRLSKAFEDDKAGIAMLVERGSHEFLGCEVEG
jgi:late competence protein required for DNA uptake (superfamily II DNA/RNA helicase)